MKKLLFLFSLSFLALGNAFAQKAKVNANLQFSEPVDMVFISYRAGDDNITDSSKLVNNKVTFSQSVSEPTLGNLMVRFKTKEEGKRPSMDRMPLFLESGIINITAKDSLKFAKVSGSKSHAEFEKIAMSEQSYNKRGGELNNKYREFSKAKDQEGMDKIDQEFDKLTDEKNENVYGRYLKANPNSPIALYVLNQYAGYDLNVPKMEPLFNRLSEKNKKSAAGVAFSERLETSRKTAVGAMAMEFTQIDTLGIPVSLASFRGKYVLIDFWASWCGPCRAENPNVVKAFNEYKDKGFTVLGISLDQPGKQQAWMDAIHKDNLTWTQLSDLKGWKNEVSTMYGIRAIPQNLLLDPSGKIIAKNIRGEELPKTLKSMIK